MAKAVYRCASLLSQDDFIPPSPVRMFGVLLSYELHLNQRFVKVFATDFTTTGEPFSFQTYADRFSFGRDFPVSDSSVFIVEAGVRGGFKTLKTNISSSYGTTIPDPVPSGNPNDQLKNEFILCEFDIYGKVFNGSLELQKCNFTLLTTGNIMRMISDSNKYLIDFMKRLDKRISPSYREKLNKSIDFEKIMLRINPSRNRSVSVSVRDLPGYNPHPTNSKVTSMAKSNEHKKDIYDQDEDYLSDESSIFNLSQDFEFRDASKNQRDLLGSSDVRQGFLAHLQEHSNSDHLTSTQVDNFNDPSLVTAKKVLKKTNINDLIEIEPLDGTHIVDVMLVGHSSLDASPIRLFFVEPSATKPSGLLRKYLAVEFGAWDILAKMFGVDLGDYGYDIPLSMREALTKATENCLICTLTLTNLGVDGAPIWTVKKEDVTLIV